jgi:SAM-dependent methyltransferase
VTDGRTDGDGNEQWHDRADWWTSAYEAGDQPWSTGRPQSAIVEAVTDPLDGSLLDVGCGVGEHARHFAAEDVPTVGVDFARPAVERAHELAREASLDAEFHVADALDLDLDPAFGPFVTVVDVGMFHTLEPRDHGRYAASLAGVTRDGGRLYFLEFGPDAPADHGPRPVPHDAFERAFSERWQVDRVEDALFETRERSVSGVLAVVERR